MYITLESDYAVRIVDCLAVQTQKVGAGAIAELTGVTPRFTLKILHKLVSAQIVRSYKGAKGGYELARPAGEITLREVIETVEGPYAFSRCLDPNHACKCESSTCKRGSCRFQRVYDEISETVRQKLETVTFER
ncbi:MAG: Rrf2 family transcriptional regulator [Oscillospiraceae bacterium]|nr:Rrf2 family transcriptional regulator [Oscillospiraceae bacterium]MBP1578416.1 Rrf2 family transcriptional regulator [Oscillospiraceae bacterium]